MNDKAKCKKCGRTMGEHPVPSSALKLSWMMNDHSHDDDADYWHCEGFVDPDDTYEEETDDVTRSEVCGFRFGDNRHCDLPYLHSEEHSQLLPRSEVHGVSTAGYNDELASTFAEAHKPGHGWTCARINGHVSPTCVTGGPVARRMEEIKRVQTPFRWAWGDWYSGRVNYMLFPKREPFEVVRKWRPGHGWDCIVVLRPDLLARPGL